MILINNTFEFKAERELKQTKMETTFYHMSMSMGKELHL